MKCIQTKPDDAACITGERQVRALRGAATAARAKLLASVAAKCGATVVSSTDLRGKTGLGYDGVGADCLVELGHAPRTSPTSPSHRPPLRVRSVAANTSPSRPAVGPIPALCA